MILPPPPEPQRDAKGRWVAGAPSPNPKGRPHAVPAEVRKLARDHGIEAIEKLIALMRDSPDERVQHAATRDLLDRGYGKPVQPVETGGPGAFEEMDEAELIDYARRKSAELLTPSGD